MGSQGYQPFPTELIAVWRYGLLPTISKVRSGGGWVNEYKIDKAGIQYSFMPVWANHYPSHRKLDLQKLVEDGFREFPLFDFEGKLVKIIHSPHLGVDEPAVKEVMLEAEGMWKKFLA